MNTFFRVSIIFLLIVAVVSLYGGGELVDVIKKHITNGMEDGSPLSGFTELSNQIQDVFVPGPLVEESENSASYSSSRLTEQGIILHTNKEREKEGLLSLRENALLASSAQRKVEDMFERQYFEHESPTGEGVADIGSQAGYGYIIIGENLARGNFGGDASVVRAWMASQGHKENILNGKYTEIGIGVAEGMYKGKKTWMAVQHFGRPLSLCPSISQSLKVSIELNHIAIKDLEAILLEAREEIADRTSVLRPGYEEKVNSFNVLVAEFNALVSETKAAMALYNAQVADFNACTQQ